MWSDLGKSAYALMCVLGMSGRRGGGKQKRGERERERNDL